MNLLHYTYYKKRFVSYFIIANTVLGTHLVRAIEFFYGTKRCFPYKFMNELTKLSEI